MTERTPEPPVRPMCSIIARAREEPLIGSISGHARYLLAEIPLPWAADVQASSPFPPALREALERHAARGADVRFLGLVPDPGYSREGFTRVIDLQRPPSASAEYAAASYLVPTGSLARFVDDLLASIGAARRCERYQIAHRGRDLLVCTHGTRDACCATFGFPAYRSLRHELAPRTSEPVRVWRVSHLGGHRFAPTVIDFPEGRAWGHLDEEALTRLVRHEGPLPDPRRRYRGWTLLGSSAEILVEREILIREGWDWTRYQVQGSTREVDGAHVVRLAFQSADGADAGAYEATVEPTGEVIVSRGSCRDDALHETAVHRVRDLRRIEGALMSSNGLERSVLSVG